MTHATVMAVMWLRGEDDELLPDWQNRAACSWELIKGEQWGRFVATMLEDLVDGSAHAPPADLCPLCAVLIDVARETGRRDALAGAA